VNPSFNPLVENLYGFLRGLRQLHFELSHDDLYSAIRALEITGATDAATFYQVLRTIWCKNRHDVALFELAFVEWLLLLRRPDGAQAVRETFLSGAARRRRQEGILTNPSWFMGTSGLGETEETDVLLMQGASQREFLDSRQLDRLTEEEMHVLMALYRPKRPLLMPSHLGRPDFKGRSWNPGETMRRGREGSEWVRLYYDRPRFEPLALTVLLDMSGSMAGYHRPFLQFLHAMMRHERGLNVYAFSTRLTSVTRALKHFHVDRALAEVSGLATDRGGGTRIGESLKVLWQQERGRGIASRSTLVVVSDGLEEGDGELLDRWSGRWQRYLHGRTHWWNPFEVLSPGALATPSARSLARHAHYAVVPTFKALVEAWSQLNGMGAL
jgi:uncharacterized protein with von Willebrand factor type A (vWA) domain